MSQAIVIAIGVTASGEREVLGLDVGPSESGAFWLAFLRGLVARGLNGVRLVISDAHSGLKMAISAILQGAVWQRCRVHYADLRIMPTSRPFQFRFSQIGRHNQRNCGQADRVEIATVWRGLARMHKIEETAIPRAWDNASSDRNGQGYADLLKSS